MLTFGHYYTMKEPIFFAKTSATPSGEWILQVWSLFWPLHYISKLAILWARPPTDRLFSETCSNHFAPKMAKTISGGESSCEPSTFALQLSTSWLSDCFNNRLIDFQIIFRDNIYYCTLSYPVPQNVSSFGPFRSSASYNIHSFGDLNTQQLNVWWGGIGQGSGVCWKTQQLTNRNWHNNLPRTKARICL